MILPNLANQKLNMVLINHVAGDGASPSVLKMILICCNHVLNLTGDFRGTF